MKKFLSFIFLLCSASLFAQQGSVINNDLNNEEQATLRAKLLAMQLDLNEDQKVRLKELFRERIEAIDKLQEENREITEEQREFNESQKAELREILNEEQYSKWERLRVKRHLGRKNPEIVKKN